MRKIAALLVAALIALGLALTLSATAQADPYQARVATNVTVDVPPNTKAGARLTARVRVTANAPAPEPAARRAAAAPARAAQPTGRVRLVLRKKDGPRVWSKTVRYPGKPIRVQGPRLTDEGRYRIRATFVPDDEDFYRSSADADATLVTKRGNADDDPGDGNGEGPRGGDLGDADGLLPDTGGPNVGWLVLGLGLLGVGGGTVAAARREQHSPYQV